MAFFGSNDIWYGYPDGAMGEFLADEVASICTHAAPMLAACVSGEDTFVGHAQTTVAEFAKQPGEFNVTKFRKRWSPLSRLPLDHVELSAASNAPLPRGVSTGAELFALVRADIATLMSDVGKQVEQLIVFLDDCRSVQVELGVRYRNRDSVPYALLPGYARSVKQDSTSLPAYLVSRKVVSRKDIKRVKARCSSDPLLDLMCRLLTGEPGHSVSRTLETARLLSVADTTTAPLVPGS